MLLIHQAGTVKIGEVVRYTLTYTPSNDRILPTPSHLHLKIKNTSAIPLRAAWVHGPYAVHVSAYPSTFNPHHKVDDPKRHGVPDYEPMLKAGGSWISKLTVPEEIRETGADLGKSRQKIVTNTAEKLDIPKATWIIEISSQILFSNSASVGYEVLVGRDERSLDLGFAAVASHGHGAPGQIENSHSSTDRKHGRSTSHVQRAGVYSKSIELVAENTEALWDKPALPKWEGEEDSHSKHDDPEKKKADEEKPKRAKKRRKIHLVILSHGLHSNLGADMLFLKESIDATVTQARLDAKDRKKKSRTKSKSDGKHQTGHSTEPKTEAEHAQGETATAPLSGGQEELENNKEEDEEDDEDEDEEQTIVRGFSGNAAKTENGIQYLGKRLAKYILRFTYPDQPFLPIKKPFSKQLSDTFKSDADKAKRDGTPSHQGSSIHKLSETEKEKPPYQFTSISFVGHSLGGLVQTYAVAYIQKHSPTFFQHIKPINFICMASPMLGLSNENPMYVKFALDFGLVGRTGQDLGLTWRAPTIARGGWNAVIGGLGVGQKNKDDKAKQEDPAAKPLLRILPTGPAHKVLRMFRNRTVYSNVVNDGIVPLRTSCLLFLDWRGLGKVEKARRENGLLGTMAEWGWAELTGANSSTIPANVVAEHYGRDADTEGNNQDQTKDDDETVPQPDGTETTRDNTMAMDQSKRRKSVSSHEVGRPSPNDISGNVDRGFFGSMVDFFRTKPNDGAKTPPHPSKAAKAFRRAQTVHHEGEDSDETSERSHSGTTSNPTMRPHLTHLHSHQKRPLASRGDSTTSEDGQVSAPPKTSIFESAGDVLHPPLPSRQWITDPSNRSRTIFHDRVYHPEDIPPPPVKRASKTSWTSSKSSDASSTATTNQGSADTGSMKVEEKIARAYHRDLSWRKVLVRLEPDAHNNMIVRRMFANAYGWPVVKHLCDTHFADTFTAQTRDEDEPARERAPPLDKPVPETGEQVAEQTAQHIHIRSDSEMREERDELTDLTASVDGISRSHSLTRHTVTRRESEIWDDAVFEGSDNEDSDYDDRNFVARLLNPHQSTSPPNQRTPSINSKHSVQLTPSAFSDGHRGLGPVSPTLPGSPGMPRTTSAVMAAMQQPVAKSTFDSGDVEGPVLANQLVAEPQPVSQGQRDSNEIRDSRKDANKSVTD